jgi:hypothetical protein
MLVQYIDIDIEIDLEVASHISHVPEKNSISGYEGPSFIRI